MPAALLAVAALTPAAAGCRLGPEAEGSGASLTVTRDFGAKVIARASEKELPDGETVMRLLAATTPRSTPATAGGS